MAVSSETAEKRLTEERNLTTEESLTADYTLTQMIDLLTAHKIPYGVENTVLRNPKEKKPQESKSQHSHLQQVKPPIYFYHRETIHNNFFLEDNIKYFWMHHPDKDKMMSRRFVLLFNDITRNDTLKKEISALIITLSECDQKKLDQLKQQFLTKDKKNYDELLKDNEFTQASKHIYTSKTMHWLGAPPDRTQRQEQLLQLLGFIQKAYAGDIKVNPLTLPEKHRHIILSTQVLNILGMKQPDNLSLVSASHQQKLIDYEQALRKTLSERCHACVEQDPKLIMSLIIFYKSGLACAQLQRLWQMIQNKNYSTEKLDQLFPVIRGIKQRIYQRSYAVSTVIQHLPFSFLKILDRGLESTGARQVLFQFLNDERKILLHTIRTLERNFSDALARSLQSQSTLARYYSKKVLSFLYSTTLIQFSASFLEYITGSCSKRWNKNRILQASRNATKRFIRWSLQDIENSETTARFFERAVEKYMTVNSVMYLMGAGMGAWFSMGASSYTLTRQVLISALSLKIFSFFQNNKIDDEWARYSENLEHITPLHCAYLAQILMVMLEYHYSKDLRYVIKALGGATGGSTVLWLTRRALPGFANPSTPELAKEAGFISFFLYMGGNALGYEGSNGLVNYVDKIVLQRNLALEFQAHIQKLSEQNGFAEYEVEGPKENNYFLGWRYKNDNTWYKTNCTLHFDWVPGKGKVLHSVCEIPSRSLPLIGL